MDMQFGVQLVTHFDQQGDIVIGTKARIDPVSGFDDVDSISYVVINAGYGRRSGLHSSTLMAQLQAGRVRGNTEAASERHRFPGLYS